MRRCPPPANMNALRTANAQDSGAPPALSVMAWPAAAGAVCALRGRPAIYQHLRGDADHRDAHVDERVLSSSGFRVGARSTHRRCAAPTATYSEIWFGELPSPRRCMRSQLQACWASVTWARPSRSMSGVYGGAAGRRRLRHTARRYAAGPASSTARRGSAWCSGCCMARWPGPTAALAELRCSRLHRRLRSIPDLAGPAAAGRGRVRPRARTRGCAAAGLCGVSLAHHQRRAISTWKIARSDPRCSIRSDPGGRAWHVLLTCIWFGLGIAPSGLAMAGYNWVRSRSLAEQWLRRRGLHRH